MGQDVVEVRDDVFFRDFPFDVHGQVLLFQVRGLGFLDGVHGPLREFVEHRFRGNRCVQHCRVEWQVISHDRM